MYIFGATRVYPNSNLVVSGVGLIHRPLEMNDLHLHHVLPGSIVQFKVLNGVFAHTKKLFAGGSVVEN